MPDTRKKTVIDLWFGKPSLNSGTTPGFIRCAYCGKLLRKTEVTRDHAIPLSRGGRGSIWNQVPACVSCNQKKADALPEGKWEVKYPPRGYSKKNVASDLRALKTVELLLPKEKT
jgi:5-methylcytosine-specific restriction endonuclease McrA